MSAYPALSEQTGKLFWYSKPWLSVTVKSPMATAVAVGHDGVAVELAVDCAGVAA